MTRVGCLASFPFLLIVTEACNPGYGIILTATWLLPVALIPGTWNERDFPPSSPAPWAPPTLPFVFPEPDVSLSPSVGQGTGPHTTSPGPSGSALPSLPMTPEPVANLDPSPPPPVLRPSLPTSLPSPIPASSPPQSPHIELQPYPPSPSQLQPSPPLTYLYLYASPTSLTSPPPQLPSGSAPPAPSPRTIPLPEPHHPGLGSSRFRPLPDLPHDTDDLHLIHRLESESPPPPPPPSPPTIPLPDIEYQPMGQGTIRKAKERERKFWKSRGVV